MNKLCFAIVAFLSLIGFVAFSSTTFATEDATCASTPPVGPVGTTFVIICSGYTPNTFVYAYLVEPSGAARPVFGNGAIKVNEGGAITYTQPSFYSNPAGSVALGTGTWHFVAEEIGIAKTVLHRGETTFTLTGGTESVSGASLSVTPSLLTKPIDAYREFSLGPYNYNRLNRSDPATLSGWGFAPFEQVSFWVEPPRGGCASLTEHLKMDNHFILSGGFELHDRVDLNLPILYGLGATSLVTAKADNDGNLSIQVFFTARACEGDWHFVARGNASGLGAETFLTVIGNAIPTNATLTATPETVTALFDRVQFNGTGFGAQEHVTCWLTSPQGQTLSFPNALPVDTSFPPALSLKSRQLHSDVGGKLGFDLVTGSIYVKFDSTLSVGSDTQQLSGTSFSPVASEGALGIWSGLSLSCHFERFCEKSRWAKRDFSLRSK